MFDGISALTCVLADTQSSILGSIRGISNTGKSVRAALLRAGRISCSAVGAGCGSFGCIVKDKYGENTKGKQKASVLFKYLRGAGEPKE